MIRKIEFSFKHLAAVVALILAGLVSPVSAVMATDGARTGIPVGYKDYTPFPACSPTVTTFCVASWGIDLDGNGTFEVPAPSTNIVFSAWAFDTNNTVAWPSMAYEIRVGNNQETVSAVPAGTALTYAINTGAFKPAPSMFTQAHVVTFDVNQVNGHWITTGTVKTSGYTFATNCETENKCANPTNRVDYKSYFQGVQFYEEPNALLESKKGMWVSSTASMTSGLEFDVNTMTWTVELMAPATKIDGSENLVQYSTFLPDTFIQYAYGTTADVLTTSLATYRTDAGITSTVGSTITRVSLPIAGILISMPNIKLSGAAVATQSLTSAAGRYSTTPKLKIKPKGSLLNAPTLRKAVRSGATSIRVTGSAVRGASKYQAMCSRGSVTRVAYAKAPSVNVTGLTTGSWKCSIRGVKKIGGKWSKSSTVRLR